MSNLHNPHPPPSQAWLDVFHAHVAHREREVQLAFGGDEAPTCSEPLGGLAGGGASGWPAAATPW